MKYLKCKFEVQGIYPHKPYVYVILCQNRLLRLK